MSEWGGLFEAKKKRAKGIVLTVYLFQPFHPLQNIFMIQDGLCLQRKTDDDDRRR